MIMWVGLQSGGVVSFITLIAIIYRLLVSTNRKNFLSSDC